MRRLLPGFVLVFCLAAPAPAETPVAEAKSPRDLAELLRPIRAEADLPALAGAIVTSDGLVAIGVDGVRERGAEAKATTSDRWHIGSCTKAMTATLIGRLVEKGKLAFADRLLDAFPDAAKKAAPGWEKADLAGLLVHRAGVPGDLSPGGLWGRLWAHPGPPAAARQTLVAGVLARPPAREPGTAYEYANGGVAIAGAMAEKAAGKAYEELMAEEIFAPLDITTAGWGAPGTKAKIDEPRGHRADGTPVPPGPGADNPPAIAPAGTCHLTLGDWGKFVAAHLAGARGRDGIVKAETFRRLHAPPADGEPAYAMGFLVAKRDWAGGEVLTHAGTNTMWYAVTWIAPRKGFAVLVTTNQGGDRAAKAADRAAWALIQAQLSAAKPPAPPK